MGARRERPAHAIDDDLIAQFATMGATPDELNRLRARKNRNPSDDGVFWIDPENWNGFRIFQKVYRTQWSVSVVSGGRQLLFVRHGLIYGALEVAARALGITIDADALDAISVMEDEALRIYAEKRI